MKSVSRSVATPFVCLLLASAPIARADETWVPAPWTREAPRMAFIAPGDLQRAADAGVEAIHFNMVWPYYPLRREGGGLSAKDANALKDFVNEAHRLNIKVCLGLPPFPSAEAVRARPEWRIKSARGDDPSLKPPSQDDLGTRLCCNNGPWGEYLVELLGEMAEDYKLDGYSFDGNYHSGICFCDACSKKHRAAFNQDIPEKANLDDLTYRKYLAWRGEKLEDHYRAIQQRVKRSNPNVAITTWTVNAGRYGHLLMSPRAMTTRMNRLIDLPMQEWWLDETNLGSSVAPVFGLAYLRAVAGGPCASEPYLMSRGDPYGTDSFPKTERRLRALMATAHGNLAPQSFGWTGHGESTATVLSDIASRAPWLKRIDDLPWAAMLVSEQSRQFLAYRDIPRRFLPGPFGLFRAAMEEHLPLSLVNDWDLTADRLRRFSVVLIPGPSAISAAGLAELRRYVEEGGGLVASAEFAFADELGRDRAPGPIEELLGVRFTSKPASLATDDPHWQARIVTPRLSWTEHPLFADPRLADLTPRRESRHKGVVTATEAGAGEVVAWATFDDGRRAPAIVVRKLGKGKVVYLAAGVDAGYWSYSYPYQRLILASAMKYAAKDEVPARTNAPMCVQASYFTQSARDGHRLIVSLFNALNTTGGHGAPGVDAPLREEVVPIGGITVDLPKWAAGRAHVEPGNQEVKLETVGGRRRALLPPLADHAFLVVEP